MSRAANKLIHWVIEGVFAYGERPGFPSHTVPARTVDLWLAEAKRQGVRSVINMLSDEEMGVYYRHLGQPLIEYYSDAGMEVRQVSYEETGVVLPEQIIIDRVRTAFHCLPHPVIIHCSAGEERSKLAVDAILEEWDGDARKPLGRGR